MISALTSHIWQSTFFACAVALLNVAFRRSRYADAILNVASIKPCNSGDVASGSRGGRGGGIKSSPGRLTAECTTLDSLVRDAYIRYADGKPWPTSVVGRRLSPVSSRLLAQPIKGSPAWIKSERYSIAAKAEGRAPAEEIMKGPMMRALLEDRFKLKIHTEAGEVPVYALTVAQGGPRLEATKAGSCFVPDADHPRAPRMVPGQAPSVSSMPCGVFVPSGRNDGFDINGTTIGNLASSLSMVFDRDVIDQTGIQGMFDIHFNVHPEPLSADVSSGTPADTAGRPGERVATDADRSGMVAAFRAEVQKLGLKLTPDKGSVKFLVIDSVEKPSCESDFAEITLKQEDRSEESEDRMRLAPAWLPERQDFQRRVWFATVEYVL